MPKGISVRKAWVKDDIKLVLTQWESKTKDELCEILSISRVQLDYIANQIRKTGVNLPKKNKTGVLQNLIRESMADLKLKPRK